MPVTLWVAMLRVALGGTPRSVGAERGGFGGSAQSNFELASQAAGSATTGFVLNCKHRGYQ
jgi:hypothetical protein